MKGSTEQLSRRVQELREAFDQSFAEPLKLAQTEKENLLSVRVGQSDLCIRLNDLLTVAKARKIVPIPNAPPGLLGVCGLRERLIAVFQLSDLLGLSAPKTPPRWLLVCKGNAEVGLGLEEINAYLQISPTELSPVDDGAVGPHIRWLLKRGAQKLGVLDISSILDSLNPHP